MDIIVSDQVFKQSESNKVGGNVPFIRIIYTLFITIILQNLSTLCICQTLPIHIVCMRIKPQGNILTFILTVLNAMQKPTENCKVS